MLCKCLRNFVFFFIEITQLFIQVSIAWWSIIYPARSSIMLNIIFLGESSSEASCSDSALLSLLESPFVIVALLPDFFFFFLSLLLPYLLFLPVGLLEHPWIYRRMSDGSGGCISHTAPNSRLLNFSSTFSHLCTFAVNCFWSLYIQVELSLYLIVFNITARTMAAP